MTEMEINELKRSIKDTSDGLRKIGRDLADPNVSKAEKFMIWLMFDQMVFRTNNTFQQILDEMEPEEA